MNSEQERYFARQTALPSMGKEGQKRLLNGSALIVGLGGLGAPAATFLALSGVGRIGLMDSDVVDFSNLHRQFTYSMADEGRLKVQVLGEFLTNRIPSLELERYPFDFGLEHTPIVSNFDVILDCTDQISAKCDLNTASLETERSFCTASLYRSSAQVAFFGAGGKPCFRCLYPELDSATLASCSEIGVLAIQATRAGMLQASLAMQGFIEPDALEPGKLLQLEWNEPDFETRVPARVGCPYCGAGPEARTYQRGPDNQARCEASDSYLADTSEFASPSSDLFELENYQVSHVETGSGISHRSRSSIARESEYAEVREWEVQELLEKWPSSRVILLDVREEAETRSRPIQHALAWPLSRLKQGNRPSKDPSMTGVHIFVTVCESGIRSLEAARHLQYLGEVRSLRGGRRAMMAYLAVQGNASTD